MVKELWKKIEVDGEEYSIKKFTAMVGTEVLALLASKMTKLLDSVSDDISDDDAIGAVGEAIGSLKHSEIEWLVKICLQNAYKVLPAGPAQIMYANGTYGVEDVEYDLTLTLKLCAEVIVWGICDFFAGKSLDSIMDTMARLMSKQSQ